MSLASKITLGASIFMAVGIIYYVHAKQQDDIRKMHEGVIRDEERRLRRKAENVYKLEKQAELEKILRNESRNEEATILKLLEGESDNRK